jgi:hypothetical protein
MTLCTFTRQTTAMMQKHYFHLVKKDEKDINIVRNFTG